jgi:hypothetical protein
MRERTSDNDEICNTIFLLGLNVLFSKMWMPPARYGNVKDRINLRIVADTLRPVNTLLIDKTLFLLVKYPRLPGDTLIDE